MATGYTANIIDGKINTFEEFAKQCIRAFGASIHMRDESLSVEYKPREPDKYYIENVANAEKFINDLLLVSKETLYADKISNLHKERENCITEIENIKKLKQKLQSILEDAIKFEPPTPDHQGIKDFMIEQLESTISFDCTSSYYDDRILSIDNQLKTLTFDSVKEYELKKAQDEVIITKKRLQEEIERCEKSNLWAQQYFESLENKS